MKKKYIAGIFAIFAIAILGVGLVSAFGMGKGKMTDLSDEEQTAMQEFQTAVQEAIEAGNYDTWKALMESQITEETFAKTQEMHKEMQTHRAEMQEAFESGEMPQGQGFGMHKGMQRPENAGECPFAK